MTSTYRTLFLTTVFSVYSSVASSQNLTCAQTKGGKSDLFPSRFTVSFTSDRKSAVIFDEKGDTFGASAFRKSYLGNDYWSIVPSNQNTGELNLSHRVQFRVSKDSARYKLSTVNSENNLADVAGACGIGAVDDPNLITLGGSTREQTVHDAKVLAEAFQCASPVGFMNRAVDDPAQASIIVKAMGLSMLDNLITANLIAPNALSESILRSLAEQKDNSISDEDRLILLTDRAVNGTNLADCIAIRSIHSLRLREILLRGAADEAAFWARIANKEQQVTYEDWNLVSSGLNWHDFEEFLIEMRKIPEAAAIFSTVYKGLAKQATDLTIATYNIW